MQWFFHGKKQGKLFEKKSEIIRKEKVSSSYSVCRRFLTITRRALLAYSSLLTWRLLFPVERVLFLAERFFRVASESRLVTSGVARSGSAVSPFAAAAKPAVYEAAASSEIYDH